MAPPRPCPALIGVLQAIQAAGLRRALAERLMRDAASAAGAAAVADRALEAPQPDWPRLKELLMERAG
eukprot:2482331-Lingulodinium_polyedra.AAC.1